MITFKNKKFNFLSYDDPSYFDVVEHYFQPDAIPRAVGYFRIGFPGLQFPMRHFSFVLPEAVVVVIVPFVELFQAPRLVVVVLLLLLLVVFVLLLLLLVVFVLPSLFC